MCRAIIIFKIESNEAKLLVPCFSKSNHFDNKFVTTKGDGFGILPLIALAVAADDVVPNMPRIAGDLFDGCESIRGEPKPTGECSSLVAK